MWRKRPKRRLSKKVKVALFLLPLFIGGLVFFLIAKSPILTINKIDVYLKDAFCVSENQISESSGLLGKSITTINFKDIVQNIKNKFICIKEINLAYIFPSKVKIVVNGRQPVMRLINFKNETSSSSAIENIATPSARISDDAYLVDDEGIIYSKDPTTLIIPGIFVTGFNVTLGQTSKMFNFENILEIFRKIKTYGLDVQKAVVVGDSILLFTEPEIIFNINDEVGVQLASLQLILSEAKINVKKLEFIDLRFDKPIVRFAPKKNG